MLINALTKNILDKWCIRQSKKFNCLKNVQTSHSKYRSLASFWWLFTCLKKKRRDTRSDCFSRWRLCWTACKEMWPSKHVSSDECAEGQADTATVWSGHTCSCTQIWSTLQHRLTRIQTGGGLPNAVCLCVCVSFTIVWDVSTYPIQPFSLYVPEKLLPPVSGHLGSDVFRFLRHPRSYFDGVLRWFLRTGCQGVVRRHLFQQGCHGGTSWHGTSLGQRKYIIVEHKNAKTISAQI